jgi:hypothetical protein
VLVAKAMYSSNQSASIPKQAILQKLLEIDDGFRRSVPPSSRANRL